MFPHDHPFDPTYGYSLDALIQVDLPKASYEPPDLEAFWRTTYTEAAQVPPAITLRQIPSPDPTKQLSEIAFDAWDLGGRTRRIGGWLIEPIDQEPQLGLVMGHGYGGRETPLPLPEFGIPATVIMPCLRGFHRSAHPDLPNLAADHVIHGIQRRDTYLHRGRLTRKSLAFSKNLALHCAAAAWEDLVYNLVRPLKSLRLADTDHPLRRWRPQSPAMAAALTDHLWSFRELLFTLPLPDS